MVEVEYESLKNMTPEALRLLRKAFVGPEAYGAVAVVNIPGYGERRRRAFRAGVDLALKDPEGRARAAAVSNTYPGWSGTPGEETHPLQSSFLFNVKEEVPSGKPDPYFGKNIFPNVEYRRTFVELATPMHDAALDVLRGCDVLMEETLAAEGRSWSAEGRSLHRLAKTGPALAGRFICYDSGFTREDTLLDQAEDAAHKAGTGKTSMHPTAHDPVEGNVAGTPDENRVSPFSSTTSSARHAGDGLASMRTHSTPAKSAGHAGDGLASMRTHSTPVKSAGHAGDGLASMRTHSTPVKSAGHAGDGLASMRTHSTPVKSAGHVGDGLATMRTPSTPVKSAGHAGDGLASMRTHSTPVKSAGHAGDGLASMRTHSTPVKSAGHAGDGLASMRTHSTPVKSAGHAGDGMVSMRTHSTPVKSAGHAGDGLASMRTHSTPVKSAGHAGDGSASMRTCSTPVKSAGHAGDGLASMRTHATPVKSAGHAEDGLASTRTHSTPVKSAGHAGDGLASMRTHSTPVTSAGHAGDGLASMRPHFTPVRSAGHAGDGLASMRTHATPVKSAGSTATRLHGGTQVTEQTTDGHGAMRPHSTQALATQQGSHSTFDPVSLHSSRGALAHVAHGEVESVVEDKLESDAGDYWLPWHIDSNFVTVLHREMYAYERDARFAPEPEGAGLLMMNEKGAVTKTDTANEDALIVQVGAFAQIYAGGEMVACRHAVLSPRPPGIARFNFCNFWYVPWRTLCDAPQGREHKAVSIGWNAMMDQSYLNITMRQSFAAFRQFMTSPEARLQFVDSVRFKELSELFPLPAAGARAGTAPTPTAALVVDILTDVRCPFSHLSQTNLERALRQLGLDDHVVLRYHPVFLNPNVPKEGECLDDYLFREYGYTKEYAHSEDYPIRKAGLEAGIDFNPHRRVVNTFDAFCLIDAAQAIGKQREVVRALSRRYFEQAENISEAGVLCAAAEEAGLDREKVVAWLADGSRRTRVNATYAALAAQVGEVPHFLLRERVSGNGVEASGNKSVAEWEDVLRSVLERALFVGMAIPGPYGQDVWLEEANPNAPVSLAARAQHGWAPADWPYTAQDFSRMDESPDTAMYDQPRFVNHLDEASLDRLTGALRCAFRAVPPGFAVLDLCSSWASHYPQELLDGARVAVHGLNRAEVEANAQATERHVQDLNADPRLPWQEGSFDFVTLALSVQYLTDPRAVFTEMHRVLKPGGMAIIAFSHRCFIEKAVKVWAEETDDGEGHAHLISRYFQHGPVGGWQGLATTDAGPRYGDPLWLVTAVKVRGGTLQ